MKELRVLIPLVSKKENNELFLQKATEGAKEITLLLVIDKKEMVGQFGFAASEIMQGTALIEQIKKFLVEHGKRAKEIVEWGDTETKIEHIAILQKADKVFLLEQDNEYFKSLVKCLKKSLANKVETFAAAEQKPAKEENFGIGKA